jgi:hypothetical protein
MHSQFPRKPSVLVLADFFPWFFKSKQLLGFLGVKVGLSFGPGGGEGGKAPPALTSSIPPTHWGHRPTRWREVGGIKQ